MNKINKVFVVSFIVGLFAGLYFFTNTIYLLEIDIAMETKNFDSVMINNEEFFGWDFTTKNNHFEIYEEYNN